MRRQGDRADGRQKRFALFNPLWLGEKPAAPCLSFLIFR